MCLVRGHNTELDRHNSQPSGGDGLVDEPHQNAQVQAVCQRMIIPMEKRRERNMGGDRDMDGWGGDCNFKKGGLKRLPGREAEPGPEEEP